MAGPADFGVDFGSDFYGVAWPATVNQRAQVSTYGETPDTNAAEFAPEVGAPKRRRRMSIASKTLTFDVWMKDAEYTIFEAFYKTNLADGTLTFTRLDPRSMTTIGKYIFIGDAPPMKSVGYNLYAVTMTMKTVP